MTNLVNKIASLTAVAALFASCDQKPKHSEKQTPIYLQKHFSVKIAQVNKPDLYIECGQESYSKRYLNFKELEFATPLDGLYEKAANGEKLYALADEKGKYIIRTAKPGSHAEKELIRLQAAQARGEKISLAP